MNASDFVENTLLLYLRHITWIQGCYQMFKHSKYKLNYG